MPAENPSWNDTQKLLAFIILGAFILVILIWLFHPPQADPGSAAVLNTLVGALVGMAGMVVTYYFGSSSGSKAKDDKMADIALKATSNGGVPPQAPGTTTTTTTSAQPAAVTTITDSPPKP